MPGATTKYAFPYPLGTDPISDGDDQAKALAERVETVLSTTRYWASQRGGDVAMPAAGTYASAIALTLTGCPVGSVVALIGRIEETNTSGGTHNLLGRFTMTSGATDTFPGAVVVNTVLTSAYGFLVPTTVITTTAVSPQVSMDAQISAGGGTLRASTNLIAFRLT